MAFIQSIITICALWMVSVTSAADVIVPDTRTFFICTNRYICPANSYRLPHRLCYDSFDDCACKNGFFKSTREAKCIPIHPTTPPCKNDFICPANSYRIPHRLCYDSFEDCACKNGFIKFPTGEVKCLPIKPPTRAPVQAPICKNDFVCPMNSSRLPHRLCYDSFEDCVCDQGFIKSPTGEVKCLPIPTSAPIKPPTAAPVKPPTKAPVKPPTRAPRVPPTRAPRVPPTRAPRVPPTRAPRVPPTRAPRVPPTRAPRVPPTRAPRVPPTRAPRVPPTKAPVKPPTRAPRVPPTKAPVKPPVRAPVRPPTRPCTYVCPPNSSRKPDRRCYSRFEDCECNPGFYKSLTEDVCLH